MALSGPMAFWAEVAAKSHYLRGFQAPVPFNIGERPHIFKASGGYIARCYSVLGIPALFALILTRR